MSRAVQAREALMPWAGIIGAAIGGAIAHQGGADSVFSNCARASPGAVIAVCILGLLIVGAGAFVSWTTRGGSSERSARGLIATVSSFLALFMAFAIVMPMIASLMIPPCHA